MGKDIYNTLKVGDTIKCNGPKDMVSTMQDLAKSGIEADFMYEKDGEKGYWLIVTGEEMTPEEKAQIEYLRKRKSDIIENLVYACEEINRQIADVKAGRWLKAIKEYDEKCAVCVEFGSKWCADCTEQGGRYNYFKVR